MMVVRVGTESRGQKTEDRRQKTEDRRQKTEDRRQKDRLIDTKKRTKTVQAALVALWSR
jgi:hypothetical protein